MSQIGQENPRRKRHLASLGLAALLAACAPDPPPSPAGAVPAAAPPAAPVSDPAPAGAQASSGEAPAGFLGVVVAREAVDIAAEITGRLDQVVVRVGDQVRRGDLLAVLDTTPLRQDLAMAAAALRASRAEVDRTLSQLRGAESRYERRAALPDTFSKEEVSAAVLERDTAKATFEAAEARVAEQEARIEQLRDSIDRAEIRAPFDGTVASRYLDPGATVLAGAPVVHLINTADLLVRFAVPPEEVDDLALGQPMEVDLEDTERASRAVIQRIAPEIDGPSRMVFVEARLEAPEIFGSLLRAGQVARVRPIQPA